jgi:hypothetical protein
VIGLVFVGLGLYAVGSLGASIGSHKSASVAEYQYPEVDLTANPYSVPAGTSTTLTWTTTNVDTCDAFGDWSGSKPLSGSENALVWGWDHAYFELDCNGIWGEGGAAVDVAALAPLAPRAVVDQQQRQFDDFELQSGLAQTFTVGIGGWLTDVVIDGSGVNSYDQFAITRTTQSGAPASTALVSTTFLHQGTNGNIHLSKPLLVLPGQHYALTLVAPNGQSAPNDDYVFGADACGNQYTRGSSYYQDGSAWVEQDGCDLTFSTHVVERFRIGP